MRVFADESFLEALGIYIVGGVVVAGALADPARASARGVLPLGRDPVRQSFHWKHEPPPLRESLLVETVVAHRLVAYVVRAEKVRRAQEEDAREACLQTLVLEALGHGASAITLDRRSEAALVQRDRETMKRMLAATPALADFAWDFGRPSAEPLLWVADAITGAAKEREKGDDRYCQAIGAHLRTRRG